jgi:hypothetical protein
VPAASRRPFAASPASGDVALAGPDGRELARLIRSAKAGGVKVLADLTRGAVERRLAGTRGPLFDRTERERLAQAVAAVNGTADLLGRVRVREQAARSRGPRKAFAAGDEPFGSVRTFADGGVVIVAPEDALDYFLGLVPELGVDPKRWLGEQRRRAFTVAASTEDVLTRKIQQVIADAMRAGENRGASVDAVLEAAGVSPANPQYADMVMRTNAQDAYQTAVYEEARHPDVRAEFPVWQYQGIDDHRAGADHRPKFGRYYPATAAFADVRGPRPFNCRCGLEWIDRHTWAELQSQGARAETSW